MSHRGREAVGWGWDGSHREPRADLNPIYLQLAQGVLLFVLTDFRKDFSVK